jgi:hypothetical protein
MFMHGVSRRAVHEVIRATKLCLTVVLDTVTVTVCIHQPFASESSDDSASSSSSQQQPAWWLTRGGDVARGVKPIWSRYVALY